jgi:hypothetical protein
MIHMLQHMYVVPSADDLSFLSAIEFVWCEGKKCKVVGTRHIMDGILLLSIIKAKLKLAFSRIPFTVTLFQYRFSMCVTSK